MYLKNTDTKKRYSIFPIKNQDLWDFYKKAEKQLWVAEEVDLSKDRFDELSDDEKKYLKNILAFFTISDGLVIENLVENVINNIDIEEAAYYFRNQAFIEGVHQIGYATLVDTYIKDFKEKEDLFNSMETNDSVKKKAEWAERWIQDPSFVKRLIAFALVEGLSFSSVFAGVFWFRSRNKMEGLAEMNRLIVLDENSHYEFAVYLYKNYVKDEYKPTKEEIREIVLSCFEVEKVFVEESMPNGLPGLTKEMMIEYVKFVADFILLDFECEKEFNVKNPLEYMARIGLTAKNNFFERRVGEYTRLEIPTTTEGIFNDEEF